MVADAIARDLPGSGELGNTQAFAGTLMRLLGHQYWTRMWITLELGLSHQALLNWQGQVIVLEKLKHLIRCVFYTSSPEQHLIRLAVAKTLGIERFRNMPLFDFLRRAPRSTSKQDLAKPGIGDSLIDLILRYQGHSCGLVHDRVYALWTLAARATSSSSTTIKARCTCCHRVTFCIKSW
jgi:hypothetical protein